MTEKKKLDLFYILLLFIPSANGAVPKDGSTSIAIQLEFMNALSPRERHMCG